ncbi:hypothetical protein RUM43_007280 [Polyplax serrata]|uniref:HTH psq-type domain-containing protein n=1 Tax=Polyplax serrata TaxID=468196 RepID=A0AAN8P5G4_POLSC
MTSSVASAITKPPRRSVRSLSVQEKVHAIDRVHEGESKASVARDIGVPESTLRGWCKGEEKLRGIVARSNGGNPSVVDTPSSLDDSFDKTTKLNHVDNQINSTPNQKRDYFSLEEGLHQSSVANKFPKLDKANDVPITDIKVNQRNLESPINFSKNNENELSTRNSYSPTTSANLLKKEETRDVHGVRNPMLPTLAAIASAISNKNQLLYNAYTNGILKDMVPKQEMTSKPLDYCTKVSPRLPHPDVNDALVFWLQSQRDQGTLPMSPLEGRTADSSSWFWKLYKNYGVLPQTFPNQKSNPSNGHNLQGSDEEDEPPATAADAVRHGEKFLRWLECCSDPSVTALQILQFRYLLKNVKECAERRRQVRTRTRSRRK